MTASSAADSAWLSSDERHLDNFALASRAVAARNWPLTIVLAYKVLVFLDRAHQPPAILGLEPVAASVNSPDPERRQLLGALDLTKASSRFASNLVAPQIVRMATACCSRSSTTTRRGRISPSGGAGRSAGWQAVGSIPRPWPPFRGDRPGGGASRPHAFTPFSPPDRQWPARAARKKIKRVRCRRARLCVRLRALCAVGKRAGGPLTGSSRRTRRLECA